VTDVEKWERPNLGKDMLRRQFAPQASDLELEHFALVCRHLDLDPYIDQIVLIGRNQKTTQKVNGRDVETWELVHKPQITVAGRRAIATRTGRFAGAIGPQWCAKREIGPDGKKLPLEWLDVWDDDDEKPYAARCLVFVTGWVMPTNGTAKWSEFAQFTDREKKHLSPFWSGAPSHMLGKVAEALALRRAFPEVEQAVAYAEQGENLEDGAGEELPLETPRNLPPPAPQPIETTVRSRSSPRSRRDLDDRPPDDLYDNSPEGRGQA
jgi:hypothetical protein